MNALLKIIVLAFVFYFAIDVYSRNRSTAKQAHYAVPKEHDEEKKKGEEVDFYIRPLGNVEESDLHDAVKFLKDFYNFRCLIQTKVKITQSMKVKGTDDMLKAEDVLHELADYGKTVFVADKRLWHISECKGYTNGTTVIVKGDKSIMKETLLHEIGHTLGLRHCDNLSCIMAINNDDEETGKFCRKCRKKANKGLKKPLKG